MNFKSIAFLDPSSIDLQSESLSFFGDLNLDQIVEAATAGKQEYDLAPLYNRPLRDLSEIEYRHEVFRDLGSDEVLAEIRSFAQGMRTVRSHLTQSEKLPYRQQKEWWFVRAVHGYCGTVRSLAEDLAELELDSRGLRAFRQYLSHYLSSERFTLLASESERLLHELSSIRYSLLIKDSSVTVRRYDEELDYGEEVHRTFAKFRQGAVKSYLVEFNEWAGMNHVEAAVVERVAMLYPELFQSLGDFARSVSDFMDETIRRFDREIQFYVAYKELVTSLEKLGLQFCYPAVTVEDKNIWSSEGFDLALAVKLAKDGVSVVTNDFTLQGKERIFVVNGPNQGGKTTFARAFGQLHYLAALGCPVPGREARLFLFDNLYTHFEREEDIANLRGKLHEDLVRMREILDRATERSVVILNEIFSSTTLSDELFLSERVLREVLALDCIGVCVTFIDELSRLSERTVSMMSTVVSDNPAERTFKVVRKPADGLAYAMAIAQKHHVTYKSLKERLEP